MSVSADDISIRDGRDLPLPAPHCAGCARPVGLQQRTHRTGRAIGDRIIQRRTRRPRCRDPGRHGQRRCAGAPASDLGRWQRRVRRLFSDDMQPSSWRDSRSWQQSRCGRQRIFPLGRHGRSSGRLRHSGCGPRSRHTRRRQRQGGREQPALSCASAGQRLSGVSHDGERHCRPSSSATRGPWSATTARPGRAWG